MKFDIKSYSKYYWIILLVFLLVFTVGQLTTARYFTQGLSFLDLFELVVAPACCFSLASLFGMYKDRLLLVFSTIYIWLMGSLFYACFQKLTFFKDGSLSSLFITNSQLFGFPLALQCVIAVMLCHFILNYQMKKERVALSHKIAAPAVVKEVS